MRNLNDPLHSTDGLAPTPYRAIGPTACLLFPILLQAGGEDAVLYISRLCRDG